MGGPTRVKRVKSGCVTCRIRRVKCDEEKPECKRCLSTGRKCDGYSTLPFSRRDLQAASQLASNQLMPSSGCDAQNGLLPRLITDPAFGDLLEKRYFQFFRQRTVTSTNSLVDSRFWDRVVLQACHIEPAVKHAVLALSSLHQLSGLPHDSDTAHQHRLYAERQHHKALTSARALISSSSPQDVDRILVACVIFIIFEGVRGDYRAAAMHMDSGRAIMAQNSARLKHASRRKDLVEIEQALARLDLPAICFSDRNSPYAYNLSDFYDTNPDLTPENFQDSNEAQASFINLVRWLLIIGNHIDEEERNGNLVGMARYQAVKMRCSAAVEEWYTRFETLASRDQSSNLVVLNLRSWYMCARLMIDTESYGLEIRYDAHMHYFEAIVNYGEMIAAHISDSNSQRSFSFDLGYMIPVYLTATRCRDPILRRRAVRLLHDHPRQEGVWESVAAAAVAARWIAVEEEGLGEVRSAADVPERKRIKYIDTQIDLDHQAASVRLTCSYRTPSREVSVEWKQETTDAEVLLDVPDPIEPICAFGSHLPDFEVRRTSSSGISGFSSTECFSDNGSSSSYSPIPKIEVMT